MQATVYQCNSDGTIVVLQAYSDADVSSNGSPIPRPSPTQGKCEGGKHVVMVDATAFSAQLTLRGK